MMGVEWWGDFPWRTGGEGRQLRSAGSALRVGEGRGSLGEIRGSGWSEES